MPQEAEAKGDLREAKLWVEQFGNIYHPDDHKSSPFLPFLMDGVLVHLPREVLVLGAADPNLLLPSQIIPSEGAASICSKQAPANIPGHRE